MTPTPSHATTIGQIALTVHDLARAVAFYRDVLGLKLLFQVSNMAFFDCGGVRLMLGLPQGMESVSSGSVIYFKVDSIERETERLESLGLGFERAPHLVARMPDHELWMAFFRDPDGNALALMCEKR